MDFKESLMVEVRSQESVLNVSAVSCSTVSQLLSAYVNLLFYSRNYWLHQYVRSPAAHLIARAINPPAHLHIWPICAYKKNFFALARALISDGEAAAQKPPSETDQPTHNYGEAEAELTALYVSVPAFFHSAIKVLTPFL